jgi:hypothetical protein
MQRFTNSVGLNLLDVVRWNEKVNSFHPIAPGNVSSREYPIVTQLVRNLNPISRLEEISERESIVVVELDV